MFKSIKIREEMSGILYNVREIFDKMGWGLGVKSVRKQTWASKVSGGIDLGG
ncbi:hypothetical protein [Lacihabitans sp. LS3-19]|uniref:hypothetical protein n=1 Tax=Lacihabitans sp. LS3-19 TaxID=2487335 RepID=UPI0020CE2A4D|nr:hypothetical protein [Lacihabitans sp. LS3-19]